MPEFVEGRQSVLAALQARQRTVELVLLAFGSHVERLEEVTAAATELGVAVKWVAREQLDEMAHGKSHGGVIAVASAKPRWTGDRLVEYVASLSTSTPALLLLLEGVDDARNLGFTLRTAEAMGATAVLIKKHLWDFDSTEVSRPSSGAYERLPLVQIESVAPIVQLQRQGVKMYGCIAGVPRTIYSRNLCEPLILAIGGEKRGLSGAVRDICDRLVTIPTIGGPSSLSLSHAAGIVLAEAHRQRSATVARHDQD